MPKDDFDTRGHNDEPQEERRPVPAEPRNARSRSGEVVVFDVNDLEDCRMVILALITQPIYAVALDHSVSRMYAISFADQPIRAALNFYLNSWHTPSILFALTLGVMVIWSLRERHISLTAALLVFCYLAESKINYGFKGILLMLLFYLFINRAWLSLPVVLAFMAWWSIGAGNYSLFGVHFGMQAFAILALPLIYIPTNTGMKLPKWLFYAFYPAHMVLIYVLDKFVL